MSNVCGAPKSGIPDSGVVEVGCLCRDSTLGEDVCNDAGQLRVYAGDKWAVVNRAAASTSYQPKLTTDDAAADLCYATVVQGSASTYSLAAGNKASWAATCAQVKGFCVKNQPVKCCSGTDGKGCASCSNVKFCDATDAPATTPVGYTETTTAYQEPTKAPTTDAYRGDVPLPAKTNPGYVPTDHYYGNPMAYWPSGDNGNAVLGGRPSATSKPFANNTSPAFNVPQAIHSGGIPFKECSQKLGCFANQGCFSDLECVGGFYLPAPPNKCIPNRLGGFPGTCDYAPAIPRMYGFWGLMSVTILTWIVCCFFAWRRDRAAAAPRRGKEEPKQ